MVLARSRHRRCRTPGRPDQRHGIRSLFDPLHGAHNAIRFRAIVGPPLDLGQT
jgi:hypothetical protein